MPAGTIATIAEGGTHACALTIRGDAFCWGFNRWGQLGIGETDSTAWTAPNSGLAAYDTTRGSLRSVPVRVATGIRFASLTAGERHTCGLTHDGQAYCWGFGGFGALGTGSTAHASVPVAVTGSATFTQLSAGGTHTCGRTADGAAYCWGGNWHGQLGDGSLSSRASPVPVSGGLKFAALSAGGIHSCGLAVTGAAYCWGDHRYGKLGTGREDAVDQPEPVPVAGGHRFAAITSGWAHACGVTARGAAYCWGSNVEGQVGSGSAMERHLSPMRAATNSEFHLVSAGPYHTCGITQPRTTYCWGLNRHSQLGDRSTTNRRVPTPLPTALTAVSVHAGGNDFSGYTCVLSSASRIHCWGDNTWGQLGSGSMTPSSVPLPVMFPPL